jgi:hypothetical protein
VVVGALVGALVTRGWEDWRTSYERYAAFDGFADGFRNGGVFDTPPPRPPLLP